MVTVVFFVVALVGFGLGSARQRAIGAGWLCGYVVFGLTVDYRISTYDYYSMPLLPIVALGFGMAVSWLATTAPSTARRSGVSLVAVLVIGLVAFWRDERAVHSQWTPIVAEYCSNGGPFAGRTAIALSEDSGGTFGIYARVRFVAWPTGGDLNLDQLSGKSNPGGTSATARSSVSRRYGCVRGDRVRRDHRVARLESAAR